ncbi:PAS domain S-box protein [bacterium]|nr:PAS domain S-box protein [bacterium]
MKSHAKEDKIPQASTERLTRVLGALNELSKARSMDALCRRAMELAIDRLGFDRIGMCFLSEDHQTVLGVYGTDENGRLRDERHLRRPVRTTPTVRKLLDNPASVLFFENEILYNDKVEKVGVGDHAVARLWNGEEVIGILAVDNLIRRKPIDGQDMEILDLYATALGHLCTLKKTEEALRESENRFRALFEQAAVGVAQTEAKSGTILKVNRCFGSILGYSVEELQGRALPELAFPSSPEVRGPDRRFLINGKSREQSGDVQLLHRDGTPVWVHLTLSAMESGGSTPPYTIAVAQDITSRKRMEDRIRTDIREKNTLLQEVHHRVKNNMQIIVSLLNLQASPAHQHSLKESFKAVKSRIHSMALVHEMLYQSKDLSGVLFDQYIERLVKSLFHSFGADSERIGLELNLEPIPLKVDHAIPCGLILQELVSNALKYAFPAGWIGKPVIRIDFGRTDQEIELSVADNGVGMPVVTDIDSLKSLGFRLIHMLGRVQLHGTIRMEGTEGTRISLRFREAKKPGASPAPPRSLARQDHPEPDSE